MGRRLPWKTGEEAPATIKTERNVATDSPGAVRSVKRDAAAVRSSSPPAFQTQLPVTPKKRKDLLERDFTRSPSTSPPPEPPKAELMIPGIAHDDRFRMVEDEFLSIARLFTAHLHRVEYARLKNLAASQNAAAIREIERPVVGGGRKTAERARRSEQKRRGAKQKKMLGEKGKGVEGNGEMTGLRGLLESPRKDRRRVGGREVKTRTGEDLDRRQGNRRSKTEGEQMGMEAELPQIPLSSSSRVAPSSSSKPTSDAPGPRAERSSPPLPRTTAKEVAVVEVDDDDDDPFGMKRRRARREKSREKLRRTDLGRGDGDFMPSF